MRTLLIVLMLALPSFAAASKRAPADPPATAVASSADHTEAWRALLASRRATNIARLVGYTDASVFPMNVEDPGMVHPSWTLRVAPAPSPP